MSELIDREALLDECLNHYEVGNIEQNCTMDWICKTVRNFPAAPRWHRVEEPPKEGQNVLTMDANEDMETATYDGEGFEDSYGFYVTDVLYWMPIEPPREDA